MVRKIDELAPFRDGREELLEGRVSDINYYLKDLESDDVREWWESNQRLCDLERTGELQGLLFDLGYSLQEVHSEYFRDSVVEMYSRGEGGKDNLVIGQDLINIFSKERINRSGFFYVQTSKKEQKVLEDNLPYVILGKEPNLKYKVSNFCSINSVGWSVVSGCLLASGLWIPGAVASLGALGMGALTGKEPDPQEPDLHYLLKGNAEQKVHHAVKKLKKLDLKYSIEALQLTFRPQEL